MTDSQLIAFSQRFSQLADAFEVIGRNRPYRNAQGLVEPQDAIRYAQIAFPTFSSAGKTLRDLVVQGGLAALVFWTKGLPEWQHDLTFRAATEFDLEPLDNVSYWVLFTALALEQPTFADGFEVPVGHEPKTWGGAPWPDLVREIFRNAECEHRFLDPTGAPDKVYLCALSHRLAKVMARECRREASPDGDTGYRTRTDTERVVLKALSRSGEFLTQIDLAECCHISRRKLGPIVKQLEQEGLVDRPDGAHSGYRLTPKGRDLL